MNVSKATIPFQNKRVLLDTCILQYLDKKGLRDDLFKVLDELERKKNILRVSDYTTFELFSGCYQETEKSLVPIWKKYKRYIVNTRVLTQAAHFSTVLDSKKYNSPSAGDKIIGMTALLTNSLVLTSDSRGFPRPFFSEEYIFIIIRRKKKKLVPLVFYFLKPEIRLTQSHIESII